MAVKKKQTNLDTLYFCTFTCYRWLPLIEITNTYDAVYKWFDVMHQSGNAIAGYVIMPNHIHVLIYLTPQSKTLNLIIGNAKRFLAYEIVRRLETAGRQDILQQLNANVRPEEQQNGKKHNVWESSFDAKECVTEKFIVQKLNYMHNNPLSGKWQLAETPEAYVHSSCYYYATSEQGVYSTKDYRDIVYHNDGL